MKKKLILKNKKEKPSIKKERGRRLFLGKGGCRENCGEMYVEAFTESVLWKNEYLFFIHNSPNLYLKGRLIEWIFFKTKLRVDGRRVTPTPNKQK